MKPDIQRVSLAFTRGSDEVVETTTMAVQANLYDNPDFATPPVAAPELASALADFRAAKAAMAQGGTAATAVRDNRKVALVALLRELALYVQGASDDDLAKLLSSGFQAVSKNRAQEELPPPANVEAASGIAGQLLLTVERIPNARTYEVQVAELSPDGTPGAWVPAGSFTRSRNMRVDGLPGGVRCAIKIRAVGGATGYSGWSDPVIHRVP